MSAWPKRYDVDGIAMEEKYDLDLQQARATSWHDDDDPEIPDLVAASAFSSSNSVESDVEPVTLCKNWGSQRGSTWGRPVSHHIYDPFTVRELQLFRESTPGREFAVDDRSLPTESALDIAIRHRLATAYGDAYRDTADRSAASSDSSAFASLYPTAANATLPDRYDDDSGGGKATLEELADGGGQTVAISSAANATSSDAPSESSREPRGASDAVNVADSMFASLYLASAAPAPVPPAAFDNGGGKADRCYVDDVISAPADSNPPVEAPEF